MSTSGTAARAIALAAVSRAGTGCLRHGQQQQQQQQQRQRRRRDDGDTTITAAYEQEFGAYNNNTADQNAVKNTVVLAGSSTLDLPSRRRDPTSSTSRAADNAESIQC